MLTVVERPTPPLGMQNRQCRRRRVRRYKVVGLPLQSVTFLSGRYILENMSAADCQELCDAFRIRPVSVAAMKRDGLPPAHGLIYKLTGTHRYHLSKAGRKPQLPSSPLSARASANSQPEQHESYAPLPRFPALVLL